VASNSLPPPASAASAGTPPRRNLLLAGAGVVVVAAVGYGGWTMMSPWAGAPASRDANRAMEPSKADASTPAGLDGNGVVELRDLRLFTKSDTDTALYYVAELVNVSEQSVAQPRAEIVLYDQQRQVLGEASCDAMVVMDLEPGQAVPCTGVVSKGNGFASHRVTTSYSAPDGGRRAAELTIGSVDTAAPKKRYGAHRVSGTITNRSAFDASDVWVIVGLYGEDGEIVGAGRTKLAEGPLSGGGTGPFSVSIFNASGRSKTSRVLVFGYEHR